MISRDGSVMLMEGMWCDGDLFGIIKRIQQEANRNQSGGTAVHNMNTSHHNHTFHNGYVNKYGLDLNLIDSLTEEQVKHLLSDEEKFHKFMTNYKPVLDHKERLLEELKDEIMEKARANIDLKMEIDHLSTKLGEAHEKYSETVQSYQNFLVLNSANLSALNPENLLTQVQVNLMEFNDLSSESIKNALNSGDQSNLDLELKECVKMRKEYHKKAILLQKLQE